MPQKIKFKKQYKPIGFGDRPDPGTVEGHRNAMAEAAEIRAFNRRMKELAAEDAAKREAATFQGVRILLKISEILILAPHISNLPITRL